MAAAMIGEGEAKFDGTRMPAGDALRKAGLTPIVLGPKEGLALINGTQFSTACALAGLWGAWRNAATSVLTCALSTDAIMGSTAPLEDAIHTLRGHRGQIAVARAQRALMDGSEIRESHVEGDTRVQDPYCIRCQPQVTGAAMDLLHFAARTLEIEANAVTDNPLVLVDDDLIVSGGNFHAEPVGFAADQIAVAISEIGAIAQRRVALMVDPTLSFDLPPFPDAGSRIEFRSYDRRSYHRRFDEREQTPRQSVHHRQHPDLCQPGRSCEHGRPCGTSFGTHEQEPECDFGGRGDVRCARHRIPQAPQIQRKHCITAIAALRCALMCQV